MAYAFKVEAPQDDGMFISKVDIFFDQKHPTLGVWFEILETNSQGQIIPDSLPFSVVWLTNDQVNISDNGIDNPTTVTFDTPIFVQKNRFYAFVIHPESGNPNYYLWSSRIGETDINTGLPVTSRKNTGRMYTTNNGLIWDVVPDIDLTMTIYRAVFTTSDPGYFYLEPKAKDKLHLVNLTSSISNYGTSLSRGDNLTISGITGGTINVSDRIVGTNSHIQADVVSITATYNTNNVGFLANEPVTINFANGTSKSVTANISSFASRAMGVIEKSTELATDSIVVLSQSTGMFSANDIVITQDYSTTAQISRIDNFRYTTIDFEPSYLKFQGTFTAFELKPYSNTGVQGSYTFINTNDNYRFDTEQCLYSRSNEINDFSNNRTHLIKTTFITYSDFVSPILDLKKTQSLLIDNIVNNNTTNETAASGGSLYNKYISKTVTLAENQDAEDIKVVITAYRPPETDVRLWARILHTEDGTAFGQRTWIELEKVDGANGVYSSRSNLNDFIEYEYKFPDSSLTGSLGEVQYRTLANTATLTGYKHFAIKVGITANNSAIVPRVADLRVIALQI